MIVRFNLLDETYFLGAENLEEFIKNNKRKSIPLDFFKNYGTMIKIKYAPRIDYIEVIDKLYFGGNKSWWKKEAAKQVTLQIILRLKQMMLKGKL